MVLVVRHAFAIALVVANCGGTGHSYTESRRPERNASEQSHTAPQGTQTAPAPSLGVATARPSEPPKVLEPEPVCPKVTGALDCCYHQRHPDVAFRKPKKPWRKRYAVEEGVALDVFQRGLHWRVTQRGSGGIHIEATGTSSVFARRESSPRANLSLFRAFSLWGSYSMCPVAPGQARLLEVSQQHPLGSGLARWGGECDLPEDHGGYPHRLAGTAERLLKVGVGGKVPAPASVGADEDALPKNLPMVNESVSAEGMLVYEEWRPTYRQVDLGRGTDWMRIAVRGDGRFHVEVDAAFYGRPTVVAQQGLFEGAKGQPVLDAFREATARPGGIRTCAEAPCAQYAQLSLYDPRAKVFARRITLSGLCDGYPRALANAAWDLVEQVTHNEVTRSPLLKPEP